MLLNKHKDILG